MSIIFYFDNNVFAILRIDVDGLGARSGDSPTYFVLEFYPKTTPLPTSSRYGVHGQNMAEIPVKSSHRRSISACNQLILAGPIPATGAPGRWMVVWVGPDKKFSQLKNIFCFHELVKSPMARVALWTVAGMFQLRRQAGEGHPRRGIRRRTRWLHRRGVQCT